MATAEARVGEPGAVVTMDDFTPTEKANFVIAWAKGVQQPYTMLVFPE